MNEITHLSSNSECNSGFGQTVPRCVHLESFLFFFQEDDNNNSKTINPTITPADVLE